MKSLWKTILDGLTFKDLVGKRHPRTYVVFTGLTLGLAVMALGMAALNRYVLMRRVQAEPVPVSLSTQTSEVQTAPTEIKESSGCPINPADWSFSPTAISETYLVIQPACVYQGLERTIAWALAIRMGYSRAEATTQLGFDTLPVRPVDTVTIPTETQGLMDVPVGFSPLKPALTEWRLDPDGEPAVAYALRGCFRTSTISGNRVEIWGGDYPVMCLVSEDAWNTSIVYSLEGHTYATTATPTRSFLLFGYLPDGNWVWLGTRQDPKMEIADPQENARERLTVATLYDSRPWDADWLLNTYHLIMQAPPENWASMQDENEKQTILNLLSIDPQGTTP